MTSLSLSSSKSADILGFLKSAPINTTFLPVYASVQDKLIEQKVLPSPETKEETEITFVLSVFKV